MMYSSKMLLMLGVALARNTDQKIYQLLDYVSYPQQPLFSGQGSVMTLRTSLREQNKHKIVEFFETHLLPVYDARKMPSTPKLSKGFVNWRTQNNTPQLDDNQEPCVKNIEKSDAVYDHAIPRKRIFISHSSKDKKLAATLAEYLGILGHSCFVAHDSISGGEDWSNVINTELQRATVFIALLTKNFETRAYCHQECGFAICRAENSNQHHHSAKNPKIIPISFDGVRPEAMLSNIQAINIGAQKIAGAGLAEILSAIEKRPSASLPFIPPHPQSY